MVETVMVVMVVVVVVVVEAVVVMVVVVDRGMLVVGHRGAATGLGVEVTLHSDTHMVGMLVVVEIFVERNNAYSSS
jgi:hypothetical protein